MQVARDEWQEGSKLHGSIGLELFLEHSFMFLGLSLYLRSRQNYPLLKHDEPLNMTSRKIG